jgi:ABC-type phosphate/phosphonate transport system substrate-binding protein
VISNFLKYLASVFVLAGLFYNNISYCQQLDDHIYRLVISSSMFQNAKTADIEASTKILAAELKKISTVQEKFEISVCETESELTDSLKLRFDLLYISPVDYLQLKSKFSIEPCMISEIDNNYGDIYYLVTKKSEGKKSIKDLKDGSINILSNAEDQAPSIWLDKLLRENNLPSKNEFFNRVTFDYKTNNVLLPVFFKKVSAAIVTKSAFETMCELNPKIKLDTEILFKSKPIVRALFCFDGRNKDTERKTFLLDYLQNLHHNNYGKQVLSLYMVNRIIPYKPEYLITVIDLYN